MISHQVSGRQASCGFQDFNPIIYVYSVCNGNLESIKSATQKWSTTKEDLAAQSFLAVLFSRSMGSNYNSNKSKQEYLIMKHLKKQQQKQNTHQTPPKPKQPPQKPTHTKYCWKQLCSSSLPCFVFDIFQPNFLEKGQEQNCWAHGNAVRLIPSFHYRAHGVDLENCLGLFKLIINKYALLRTIILKKVNTSNENHFGKHCIVK